MLLITKLKDMNKDYRHEESDTKNQIRHDKFETLEKRIEATLKKLTELEKTGRFTVATNVPKIGEGRVKSLAAFHTARQDFRVNKAKLTEELIRLRQWLVRQGAQLTLDGKIIWRKSQARVVWDHELAQQLATKVDIRSGRLVLANGKPLDTKFMATHFSGPGYAIYVMSGEGNLHVSSHSAGHRHHSSLLAGAPVAGAGELRVSDGFLKEISNKSGHYWPEPFHLVQVVKQLIENGLPRTGYTVICREGRRDVYPSADEFLKAEDIPPVVAEAGDLVDTGYSGGE